MTRHPELEAILQARYDLQTCEPSAKEENLRKYQELLDEVIRKGSVRSATREELEKLLAERYREFRREKLRAERSRLSRLR
jgi:hypothetical protein